LLSSYWLKYPSPGSRPEKRKTKREELFIPKEDDSKKAWDSSIILPLRFTSERAGNILKTAAVSEIGPENYVVL
jgi:hypothetical protein